MRWGLLTGLGLALLAASSAAQPPALLPAPKAVDPPVKATDVSAERARLQGQLQELIRTLNERATAPPIPAPRPAPAPAPTLSGAQAVDAVRSATNFYRDKDFDAALRTAKGIDPAALTREDRAFVQYLTGCSLRRLNRRSEAAVVFREIAAAKDDEFLAECAIWQLGLIRSAAEIEAQLEQLRGRSKGM